MFAGEVCTISVVLPQQHEPRVGRGKVIQPDLNSHSELVDSYGCRGWKGCRGLNV